MTELPLLCYHTASASMAASVGSMAGGVIMSRLKLSPVGAVKLIIVTLSTFVVGNTILLFLTCPQINMAGHTYDHYGGYASFFTSQDPGGIVITRVCWLVGWFVCLFVSYNRCDFSENISSIFMIFGTDIQPLCTLNC